MKRNETLNTEFLNFATSKKLKVGTPSHFEGEKYISAKPGTVTLHSADARCGNLYAIVLNRKSGGISTLTSYLSPKELIAYMEGATSDIKKKINQYKD